MKEKIYKLDYIKKKTFAWKKKRQNLGENISDMFTNKGLISLILK